MFVLDPIQHGCARASTMCMCTENIVTNSVFLALTPSTTRAHGGYQHA